MSKMNETSKVLHTCIVSKILDKRKVILCKKKENARTTTVILYMHMDTLEMRKIQMKQKHTTDLNNFTDGRLFINLVTHSRRHRFLWA